MLRARPWMIFGAVLVALTTAALVTLPMLARLWVENRIASVTGRTVHVQNVDVNLFTRRLRLEGFQLGDDGRSLARFDRLDGRFRLGPLLEGHLSFEEAILVGLTVRIARVRADKLNVSDVFARLVTDAGGEPVHLTLDHLVLDRGRVIFDDQVMGPGSAWEATGLRLDAHDITTATDARAGTASLTFALGDASVEVTAEQIGLRPAHVRASVALEGLELGRIWKYVPSEAAIRPEQGRFTGRMELRYSAVDGIQTSSEATIEGLTLWRRGQTQPLVTTPTMSLSSRGLVYRDGVVRAGHLEVSGNPSVIDDNLSPPRRYDLQGITIAADDLGYPGPIPGRVTLTAELSDGGKARATGSLRVFPFAVDLGVELAQVELPLLQPYLPPDSSFTVDRGRLSADLGLTCCPAEQVHLSGTFAAPGLTVGRRGQSQPFITHRSLTGSIIDLRLGEGLIAMTRLTIWDKPVLVDGSVSPPQRFDFHSLVLTAGAMTWPVEQPPRVELTVAMDGGGIADVRGTVDPSTWAADLQATLTDVDLTRARPYLPADVPFALAGGRLGTALTLKHEPGRGVRLDGQGLVTDLALARSDTSEPFLTDPSLALTLEQLVVTDGRLSAATVAAAGAPTVIDRSHGSNRRLAVPGLRLALAGLQWPASRPIGLEIQGSLPDSGTFSASGSIELDTRVIGATLTLRDGALGPFAAFLPIRTAIEGRADADLELRANLRHSPRIEARGRVALRAATLGPEDSPIVRVERVEARSIEAVWPGRIAAGTVVATRPSVLIERKEDGTFPLRAMLKPIGVSPDSRPSSDARPGRSRSLPGVDVGQLTIEDGGVRFIDRSTRPFYSEEITDLDLTLRGLTSASGQPASLDVHGIVGGDAELDLRGEVAALHGPLLIDVAGELRDFAVPRTNPYARRHLGWIARTGSLTTDVKYRIVGDRIDATNEIVVEQLNVDRLTTGDSVVKDRLGLPLGLVVSLLKDVRGDIRLSVPVSGQLGAPDFSFGRAFTTQLGNLVARAVIAPFRAIGKILRLGDEIQEVSIDPLLFEPGSVAISAEGERHVQRVADFLRASPYVGLELRSVVSQADLQRLESQAAIERIDTFRQEQGMADFPTAARRLFRATYPGQQPPDDLDAVLAGLRAREPAPAGLVEQLRHRRITIVRERLADAAGVERERLRSASPETPHPGRYGRVEFALRALEN